MKDPQKADGVRHQDLQARSLRTGSLLDPGHDHHDKIGSVAGLTDNKGVPTDTYYMAFGDWWGAYPTPFAPKWLKSISMLLDV
jgi:hypothetical protein